MTQSQGSLGRLETLAIAGLSLSRDERAIHLTSDEPLAVTSSALVGGDLESTRHILNLHVHKNYDCRAPADDLCLFARGLGIAEPFVGMMTAANLDRAQVVVEREEPTTVVAIVTVGISNPTAAGISEPIPLSRRDNPGTINIIVVIDARLTRAARVNAVITATEAKTLALVRANVRAPNGGLASGTSTDSVVVAATERGTLHEYAGPISPVGAMIGRAVRRAVKSGLE